jgi:hypothetical protein
MERSQGRRSRSRCRAPPTRAGIDSNRLLIDLKADDNIKAVKIQN